MQMIFITLRATDGRGDLPETWDMKKMAAENKLDQTKQGSNGKLRDERRGVCKSKRTQINKKCSNTCWSIDEL